MFKENSTNLELPGFKKANMGVQNGRSKSARTKEERVAAEAKWKVCHEVNRVIKLLTNPSQEKHDDILAKIIT